LPGAGSYTFRVSGSPSVPAMSLAGQAPAPLDHLYVGGYPLRGEVLSLSREDLALTWQPSAGADLVYIELASAEDGPLERVRCAFANEGRAVVPAASLPKATSQTIAVHLVHHEDVVAAGLDRGEIRFDLATTGSVRFEAPRP